MLLGSLGGAQGEKVAVAASKMRFIEGLQCFISFLTARAGGPGGVGGEVNLSLG